MTTVVWCNQVHIVPTLLYFISNNVPLHHESVSQNYNINNVTAKYYSNFCNLYQTKLKTTLYENKKLTMECTQMELYYTHENTP
jgi:hypothetical protein